jgi:drug/metabolite transporter (DMT)-like permease
LRDLTRILKMAAAADSDRKLQNRAFLGVVLMIVGLALYPLSDACIKKLMGTYTVHQTTFLRAITRLLPLLIAVFFQGGPRAIFQTSHVGSHLVRLSVNLAYTYAFMFAMSMGTLTTVYTLSYSSPLFMIILSALLLKENVSRERWFAVAIGLFGCIVAMRPGANMFQLVSLLVLLGTFLGALNKILMRRLASTEHSLAIAIYPNVMMILATFPFLFATWQPMPWSHWLAFAIVGSITAAGQYCIAQALRFAQGSVLAPIDYSTFFWVVALDFFWWQRTPDFYTLLGAAIIVSSNFYILYRARKESKPAPAQ